MNSNLKIKNAPKAQIQKYKTALKLKQATKSRNNQHHLEFMTLWRNMTSQNWIGFKNLKWLKPNNMHRLKYQEDSIKKKQYNTYNYSIES